MRLALGKLGRTPRRSSFAVGSLFAAGEQGAWYDPADMATLFQDSAGTTPVTAAGQPVGKILDKSGRGNHATQATAGSCPLLQQDGNGKYYLAFDGVDDWLQTATINLSGTDKMTLVAGVRKLSDASNGTIVEFSPIISTSNGSFILAAPSGGTSAERFTYGSRGTGSAYALTTNTAYNAPFTAVVTGTSNIAADSSILRVNGAQVASAANDQGAGNYGSWSLYMGRRAGTSLPFNGRLYGLVVRGALSTQAQIDAVERYMNQRTGAY